MAHKLKQLNGLSFVMAAKFWFQKTHHSVKIWGIDFFTSRLVKFFSRTTPYDSANIQSGLLVHVKLLLTDNKAIFTHTTVVGLVHATRSLQCCPF